MRRSRALNTAATVALIGLLNTGCTPSGGRTETPQQSPTTSTLPADVAATAAPSAFTAAGISLPVTATDVTVLVLDQPPYKNVSLTTFRAPQADARAVCMVGGADASSPSTAVSTVEASMLGGFTPEEGSRTCSPPTGATNTYINVSSADPALVTVLIYEVPSR